MQYGRSILLVFCTIFGVFAWNKPLNLHLALTGTDSEVVVSWFTIRNTTTSYVKFGMEPNALSSAATGNQSSYHISDGDSYVFWNHNVLLQGLQHRTRYYYQCGDPVAGWAEIHSFVSPPSTAKSFTEYNMSVVVFGHSEL
jgi:hypothetical protein